MNDSIVQLTLRIGWLLLIAAEVARLGANAVLAVRFTTSVMMGGAAELLAVGTAVLIEPE